MKYTKDNPLRVFEAFAGYGSQSMALQRIKELDPEFDFVNIGISEIEPNAIKAYELVHGKVKNYGDISKIDWAQVPDFDFFTYSSPCFVAGTQVLTTSGYKSIELLHKGDQVYTRDHSFQPVIALGSDGEKPVFKVSAMGIADVTCTINHPFLVRKRKRVWHNNKRRWGFEWDEPRKVLAGNLNTKEDYIGVPIIKDNIEARETLEELFIMGRYVADGHFSESKGVTLSIGKDKIESLKAYLDDSCHIYDHTQSCCRVVFNMHHRITALISRYDFGAGATNKRIPYTILALDKRFLKAFIDGYMSGDGCFIKDANCYQATTVSKELACDLVLAVQKVYGVGAGIYFSKRPDKYIIEGREVNQNDTYTVRWKPRTAHKQWYNDGEFIWYPVRKVEDLHRSEMIYNITVDENHTYIANNAVVFNCQDWSNAGLQKGGLEGSGTRSSLLWECRKAILAKKPKYLMLENVKALVSGKFKPFFNKWEQELASYGYTNYWRVLNSKDYGIPQNRERVFLISILNCDEDFRFGDPYELPIRLKDMLEENVDEKYYLDDEKVQKFIEHCDRKQAEGCGFKFEPTLGGGEPRL